MKDHSMDRGVRAMAACGLLMLAGCGMQLPGSIGKSAALDKDAPATTPATPAPERALSSYLHDLSPVIDGLTVDTAVIEHNAITTSDGIVLDSWVRRPPGDDKFPLVLYFTPYYGGGDPTSPTNLLGDPSLVTANFLVPRGYAVGLVSIRGTGNSSGCYTSGGVAERREMGEAVEYLAHLPWSNGRVGTMGVSFDGATSAELFTEAPPSLKTVVPIEAVTDYYRYGFNNGILRFINGVYPTYYVAVSGLPVGLEGGTGVTDPVNYVRGVIGNVCADQVTTQLDSIGNAVAADKTGYWVERDLPRIVAASAGKPRPSMFYIEGHQDANVDTLMAEDWLIAAHMTGVPMHMWFGQWVHEYSQHTDGTPCPALGPCRGDFFEQALLAWFDQFLKEKDTGILDAPMVQTQADDGVWRHEDDWPPKVLQPLPLYPHADGSLAAAGDTGTMSYKDNLVTMPIEFPLTQNMLPAPLSGTTLEFVGAPLEKPLRLTGTPLLETLATSSMFKANLVATLLARKPDGTQRYLNFAAQSLNHAISLESSDPDITGKPIPVRVKFFPEDNVVAAGEQLVLVISGTLEQTHTQDSGDSTNLLNYGARLMPIGAGANVTLDLAQTKLTLQANPGDRVEPISWPTEAAPASP